MPYTPSLGQALDKNEFSEVFTSFEARLTASGLTLSDDVKQDNHHTDQVLMKLPDLPPCFSSNLTSVIVMPRSIALHMS